MRDYRLLLRPRVIAAVLFAVGVAAWTAGDRAPPWPALLHTLIGTGLVIAGAVALNQCWERRSDAKMDRTTSRPLPSGRMTTARAALVGVGATTAGLAYLALLVYLGLLANGSVFIIAALSWTIYVWIYTPLKTVTAWQTPIGAVAGAAPMLLGAAVVDAPLSPVAVALFGVVFFWQFPHTMAIAWLYRRQYAAAGVKVAATLDPTGRVAGRLAVLGGTCLLPASLVPSVLAGAGWEYAAVAIVLGVGYLVPAVRFLLRPGDHAARVLLWGSLVYLPLILAALLVALRC